MKDRVYKLKSRLQYVFERQFLNYSIYKNNEQTDDLVLNFHKRKYWTNMANQSGVPPKIIRIPYVVLQQVSSMGPFKDAIAIDIIVRYIILMLEKDSRADIAVPDDLYAI